MVPAAPKVAAPRLEQLGLDRERPLVIVDVDEVLGLFMKGFGGFLAGRGYDLRVHSYGLFKNIYPTGGTQALEFAKGKGLFDEFFRTECDRMEPAPGALDALAKLGRRAEILVLSNAPAEAEVLRAGWLKRLGAPYPLLLNVGPKGPITAALTAQSPGPSAFVDDLISNLDSVAEHAPRTARFHHVADERLRPLAPRSEQHRFFDDWTELGAAIEEALGRGA